MNEEKPVDLSALDVDPDGWSRIMARVNERMDRVLDERENPFTALSSWKRPVLIAAAISIAVLAPVKYGLEIRSSNAQRVRALVTVSLQAVHAARQPTASELLDSVKR